MAYFWAKSSYSLGKITGFLTWSNYSIVVGFKLDGGRDHGVGKARDGDQRTGAGMLGDIVKPVARRENSSEKDQRDRHHGPGFDQGKAGLHPENTEQLPQAADGAAGKKGPEAVL